MWQHKILSLGFVCTLCTSFAMGNGTPKHQDVKRQVSSIEMAPIDAKKGRDYTSVQQGADQVHVYGEENVQRLYDETLKFFLKVVQDNPKAVILLPTGSTPKPFYKKLIAAFKADPKLDLSGVAFFNLDEYVGLPAVHPLSYHYYMEKNLYGPLRSIDSNRAPRKTDTYIPQVTPGVSPEVSIRAYGELFRQTVACRGGLDLAILGVGGAYPVRYKDGSLGIKGGHIAFNEPGSKVSQAAHLVQLTEKTRKDTAHRFKSLENLVRLGVLDASLSTEVPTHALTLGLKEILQADKILLLAVGEEKAPALEKAFLSPRNSDIPVSFLVGNPKVLWLLDENASARLPDFIRTQDHYTSIPKGRLSETVKQAVIKTDQLFPKGENVLILSPHPDDDVISMGAAIEHLKQRDCTVYVAYAVTGTNAVRPKGEMFEKGVERVVEALGAEETSVEGFYPTVETRAKAWVRRQEALRATAFFNIPPENLHFLACDYYARRGMPGVKALTENDLKKMIDVISLSSAKHIFFAAENDPFGAHGLSTELLAKALKKMPDLKVTLWGYRGAYGEWPLRESKHLSIIPFDQDLMTLKVRAIKAHTSQLNPLYPSFDPRDFYERATDRNHAFAQQVSKVIGHTLLTMDVGPQRPAQYAEAFRRFSKKEFIQRYKG
jgi:glucosamine-6-phosphate deaminase